MSELLFHPGDTVDGFTVLFHCGAGAFGQVYLVRGASGETCALKVLSPDRRGEREMAGLLRFMRVSHPGLLRIGKLSTLPDGRIFYTMDAADNAAGADEYVPDTLARRMRERAPLPPEELRRIMLELADALAALHRAHLLHRDIKPENILFVHGRAILADAGAVGEFDGTTLVGTPDYLPPELCLGKRSFTAADDCHALGKVLYSALTGEAPRKFPSTPRTLASPEAVALFKAAERACTPPGVSAYRFREFMKHPEKAAPSRSRRSALILTAAVLCVVIIGVAAAVLYPKRPRTLFPSPAPKTAETAAVPAPVQKPPEDTVRTPETAADPPPAPASASKPAETAAIPAPTPAPAPQPAEPTAAELLEKYRLSADEQRLVDRWLAECVAFDRRINMASTARDNALVSKLMAERKKKFPYGIDEFCGREMLYRKYIAMLTRDYNPAKRRQLELALQERRDRLKKLLDRLPPGELAKWR